jgi:SAM-dependent methyltransferase
MIVTETEQAKYRDIWTFPKYREHSPGEHAVPRFVRLLQPDVDTEVCDFGCGEGRGAVALAKAGCRVDGVDMVDVRSEDAQTMMRDFWCQSLWSLRLERRWPLGFCVDVLEHLPTEFTMLAITRMLSHCERLYLEISTEPDNLGGLIGQPLHLTVQPFTWWRDRLSEIATVRDARDLMNKAAFLMETARYDLDVSPLD